MATLTCIAAARAGGRAAGAEPIAVAAELAAGVDSNPEQSPDGVALGFVDLSAAADWPASRTLALGIDADYRDYAGADDSWSAALALDWAPLRARPELLGLSAEAACYRDPLDPSDEHDALTVGADWQPLVSARAELGLSAGLSWQHYPNPPRPVAAGNDAGDSIETAATRDARSRHAGHSPTETTSGSADEHRRTRARRRFGLRQRASERNDRLAALALDGAWHFSPHLSTQLSLALARRESTLTVEGYDGLDAVLTLRLGSDTGTTLTLGAGWYRNDYDAAPNGLARRDEGRALELAARRTLGGATALFCTLSAVDNASNVAAESYRRTATSCGLAWTF